MDKIARDRINFLPYFLVGSSNYQVMANSEVKLHAETIRVKALIRNLKKECQSREKID